MKKLLLALATTLGASLAFAQSSVTIYGILDVGYVGTNYTGVGTSPTNKQTTNTLGQSAEQASRLGFKGNEDLGGGTSAVFTIETGLNPSNSTLSTFNTRQAFIGIKQKGIGTVAIGTQYTPVFLSVTATDPGQMNNLVGDVIFGSNPQAVSNSGTAPYAGASSGSNNANGMTVRLSNSLTFTSDKFNGFGVNALVVANNRDSTQTSATEGGNNNSYGYGLAGDYTWRDLYATLAYQSFTNSQTGTLTSPTPAIWASSTGGVNTTDKQFFVGGTYDFKILKAYAQYINRKATDVIDTSYATSRAAQQVGVRGFVTPTVEGWASVGNGRVSTFGTASTADRTANFVGFQVGSNYWLSKRTNLYAIYGQNNATSESGVTALTASNYAAGVRHTF